MIPKWLFNVFFKLQKNKIEKQSYLAPFDIEKLESIKNTLISLVSYENKSDNYFRNTSYSCFLFAIELFDKKHYEKSIEVINLFLKLRPNFTEAFFYRARAYKLLDNDSSAIKDYIEILEWLIGDSSFDDYELAINKISFFIDFVPEFFFAYILRSREFIKLGKYALAEKDVNIYKTLKKANNIGVPDWAKNYKLDYSDIPNPGYTKFWIGIDKHTDEMCIVYNESELKYLSLWQGFTLDLPAYKKEIIFYDEYFKDSLMEKLNHIKSFDEVKKIVNYKIDTIEAK
jgi:tetratricopeptide (TPR) repeat protein